MAKLALTAADAAPGKLARFFNWLAAPPARNYTLGEAWAHFVQKKPYAEIHANPLRFSNAGRISERLHMAGGLLTAGAILAAAPATPLALAFAGAALGLFKVWGLAGGKLADLAFRGTVFPKQKL